MFQWIVAAEEDALRLDAFLARHLQTFSRRERAELIASKLVLINGRRASKGTRVQEQERIIVTLPAPPVPSPRSLVRLKYYDASIIVINKPAGLPSVGIRHSQTQTVSHFLLEKFPETGQTGPRLMEAGLVHRLDTDTSGLLLAARTPSAYTNLRNQFRNQSVGKYYLALVEGSIKAQGQIDLPLKPSGPRGKQMRIAASGQGQEATTYYTPVTHFPRYTLTRIKIVTGVRHQIRAHLAAIGHPLAGDTRYGSKNQRITRLCLHAETLTFRHPETGEKLYHMSSLPRDFYIEIKKVSNE